MIRPSKPDLNASGSTLIFPIRDDTGDFYQRLLMSGLRLAPVPVRVAITPFRGAWVLRAHDESCTGYLFATDGIEASESDLFQFLSQELSEDDRLTIAGRYSPAPGTIVETEAHFLMVRGRLLSSERRVMTGQDGARVLLRSRSDLSHDNVVSIGERSDLEDMAL
jgi:hypothetical protein